jgi:endonuclease YncB( thermonuclease family)
MHRRGASLVIVFAGLLALSAAGCGSSDNGVASKSAAQILAATRAAAQSASSVHVVMRSKITHGVSLRLNASMARQHAHARVSLVGLSFEVVRDGDTLYVRGNPQFNARLEATIGVEVPSGVWLKGTTKSLGQMGSFTEIENELPIILRSTGSVSKGATVKVNGQPAIELIQAQQPQRRYNGTLFVATTGDPYPIKLLKRGRETGQATFTGWNDPVTVTPPANAVDISELRHRKGG